MERGASDFFQRLANAFLSGDHEWLSGIYEYPLVVYIEGEIALERTPAETMASLFARREKALRAGTVQIRSDVLTVGESDKGRFPVRVNWTFLSGTGRVLARNEMQYFCRLTEDQNYRIEIVEFIRQGLNRTGSDPDGTVH